MKRKLILSVLAVLFCSVAFAQIVTVYPMQSFEVANDRYTTSPDSVTIDRSHYVSGQQSIRIRPSRTTEGSWVELAPIDVGEYKFAYLDFSHICKLAAQDLDGGNGGVVQYKLSETGKWTELKTVTYVTLNGRGSDQYNNAFLVNTYPAPYPAGWSSTANDTPPNNCWKKERFDLGSILSPGTNRTIYLRFLVPKIRTDLVNITSYGWLIDDISVTASDYDMAEPALTMLAYPAPIDYPSSDSTSIKVKLVDASKVPLDSVYVEYRAGTEDPAWYKAKAARTPIVNEYELKIPFFGYDTIMSWRLIATDSSKNFNKVTYPYGDTGAYLQYKAVRATAYDDSLARPSETTNGKAFFSIYTPSSGRSQYIYDQALLKQRGFKAGNISMIAFNAVIVANQPVTLQGCTIKMLNLDTSYHTTGVQSFYKSDNEFREVFSDGEIKFDASGFKTMISLNTPFAWNGESDILMEICYASTSPATIPNGANLKVFNVAPNKSSQESGTGGCFGTVSPIRTEKRPDIRFYMTPNNPGLQYDAGIASIIKPQITVQANNKDTLKVRLQNMGSKQLTAVDIEYFVNTTRYKTTWKGSIDPGKYADVVVNDTIIFPQGFINIKACTETKLNGSIIDHEPNNNCAYADVTACAGPLKGNFYIGTSTNNTDAKVTYKTFDEAFTMLKNCGIDSAVTFYVAAYGESPSWKPWDVQLEFPDINGLSDINTITFLPYNTNEVRIRFDINNLEKSWMVQLEKVSNITFKNLTFELRSIDAKVDPTSVNMIYFGAKSNHITFDGCKFLVTSSVAPQTVIFTGGASHTTISNNTFEGNASSVVYLDGADPAQYASNMVVFKNTFKTGAASAIKVRFQKNLFITDNTINSSAQSVASNYAVDISSSSDTLNLERNKIFITGTQSGLKLSQTEGKNRSIVVANNMISLMGQNIGSSQAVRLLSASNLKFVYNSLSVEAGGNNNSSIALRIDTLDGTSFVGNNILANNSLGYAIRLLPGSISYQLDYNSYYSAGKFGYNGTIIDNLPAWQGATGQDAHSMIENPFFESPTNLRTIVLPLSRGGTPVQEVKNDIDGTLRDVTQLSLGAVQFGPPKKSVALLNLVYPLEGCNFSNQENITVKLENKGIDNITSGTISMWYQLGNGPNSASELVLFPIDSGKTEDFTFQAKINLSVANYKKDSVFNIKIWCYLQGDTYRRDDTIYAQIKSNYQLPEPVVKHTDTVEYNAADTLTVTSANQITTYWYKDLLSLPSEYISKGDTFIIHPVLQDTFLFVSQKSERPLLKFTEYQFASNSAYSAAPPSYINTANASPYVLELANLGDVDVDLTGHKILVTANTTTTTIEITKKVTLKPGKVYTIQRATPLGTDTLYTQQASLSPGPTSNATFRLISPKNDTLDVFKINSGATNVSVSPSLWKGTFYLLSGCPGIKRINPFAVDSTGWSVYSFENQGNIGFVDDAVIAYRDNGCFGYRKKVDIKVRTIPNYEAGIDSIFVSSDAVCNLDSVAVSVVVHNYGKNTLNNIPVAYYVNGVLGKAENIPGTLQYKESITYTFSTKAPLFTRNDVQYEIKAIVNYPGDTYQSNDIAIINIDTKKSPYPMNDTTLLVDYGTSPLLQLSNYSQEDMLVWYDWNKKPLNDTNNGHYKVPFPMYKDTTYYVKPIAVYLYKKQEILGSGTGKNAIGAYPSVYSSEKKYSKHQIIVTASELRNMGYAKGDLNSIAFYVDSLPLGGVKLNQFEIAVSHAGSASFTNTNFLPLGNDSLYFSSNNYTLSQTGWLEHKFSKPFAWDGQRNIVIQTYTEGDIAGQGVRMLYTSATLMVLYDTSNTASVKTKTVGTRSSERHNMRFAFSTYGCVADEYTTVKVQLDNPPLYDLQLTEITSPNENNSPGNHDIKIAIRNGATQPIYQVGLSLYINDAKQGTIVNPITVGDPINGLQMREVDTISLLNYNFPPGEYTIKVILDSLSSTQAPVFTSQVDVYPETDTVIKKASFCMQGNFTIGKPGSGTFDYNSISEAVKTLKESGICGPVSFKVFDGRYEEQINIANIYGASASNPISFYSANNDSTKVILTYKSKKEDSNYVVQIENIGNISFKGMTIFADTLSSIQNLARAVSVKGNVDTLRFTNNVIRVSDEAKKGNMATVSINAVDVVANISDLLFSNNRFQGGRQSLYIQPVTGGRISKATVEKNIFNNFQRDGLYLSYAENISISKNTLYSDRTLASGDTVSAIMLMQPSGKFIVEKNIISLPYGATGTAPKYGICVNGGGDTSPYKTLSIMSNNMISLLNSASYSSTNRAIDLNGVSNLKIIYNSVVIRTTSSGSVPTFNALYSDGSVGLVIMNNNFQVSRTATTFDGQLQATRDAIVMHIAKGNNEVSPSSGTCNNFYYVPNTNATYLNYVARWGNILCVNKDTLKVVSNSNMVNSTEIYVKFRNDTNDLRLTTSDLSEKGTEDDDVQDDIDGNPRPQGPTTIGAFEVKKLAYDIGPIKVNSPSMRNNEFDGNLVSEINIRVKNFGNQRVAPEDSAKVTIYVNNSMRAEGFITKIINPGEEIDIDIPSRFQIPWTTQGDQQFIVYTTWEKDTVRMNDTLRGNKFKVLTSYNLEAASLLRDRLNPNGCYLDSAWFGISVSNKGNKALEIGDSLKIGLLVEGIVQFTATVKVSQTFSINTTQNYYFNSVTQTVNLYPAAWKKTYKVRAFCSYLNDYYHENDTTSGSGSRSQVMAYRSPDAPKGDPDKLTIEYATAVTLKAKQMTPLTVVSTSNITWYENKRDTINKGREYTTPQLFTNKKYYINTPTDIPSGGNACWSAYDSIMVTINNRPQYDVGCVRILEPLKSLAYMEKGDSVRVRIRNYGLNSVSGFEVHFKVANVTDGNNKYQYFSEICPATILPDATYDFTFKDSCFRPYFQAKNYKFSAWTRMANDNTALNDTVHYYDHEKQDTIYVPGRDEVFKYLVTDGTYRDNVYSTKSEAGLKITNVTYGLLNNTTPALANANAASPTFFIGFNNIKDTAAIFYKGYTDTISITAGYFDPYIVGGRDSAYVKVFVDWDRDVIFDPKAELFFQGKIKMDVTPTLKGVVQVPETAKTGFCRMRVILQCNADANEVLPESSFNMGEVEDYKVWVRPSYEKNLVLEKIVYPLETIKAINTTDPDQPDMSPTLTQTIKILVRNLGKTTVDRAKIHWQYNHEGEIFSKEVVFASALNTFAAEAVDLHDYDFPFGTTYFRAWVEYPDNKTFNGTDTISKQFHRFHYKILHFIDGFDDVDYFYPMPLGEPDRNLPMRVVSSGNYVLSFNQNLWQKGKPNYENFKTVVSEPNAWVTSKDAAYVNNNESYLYSPYFYTGYVKPDSIIFSMIGNVKSNALLRVDYLSSAGVWLGIVDADTVNNNWYTYKDKLASGINGFNQAFMTKVRTSNDIGIYKKFFFRMVNADKYIGNYTQFRFVFRAEPSSVQTPTEGFAIDNLRLIRAKNLIDLGVVEIKEPETITYGQAVWPKIRIHNFGSDSATNVKVRYTCYGNGVSYIPKEGSFVGLLLTDQEGEYTFQGDSLVIDKRFKDSITICAWTAVGSDDIFKDNDTCCKTVSIMPLEYDAGVASKIQPKDVVVIGSTTDITVEVTNYGVKTLQEIPIVLHNENTDSTFREVVRKEDGEPILTNETVRHTFQTTKFKADFGKVWLTVYTNLAELGFTDAYQINDTLRFKIIANNNVSDMVAEHIYLDESAPDSVTVTFAFTNKGDIGITDIPVSYYINNDTNTRVEEVFEAGIVSANKMGYHIFSKKIPKSVEIKSICAFTDLPLEIDRLNDTTCKLEIARVDMEANYMNIEELVRDNEKCRVQFVAVNKGNYPVTSAVVSLLDGGTTKSISLHDRYIVPGDTLRILFDDTNRITKQQGHNYSVVGWITTPKDANRTNDTTRKYNVVNFIVDAPEIKFEEGQGLQLGQNHPNPFEKATTIPFYIPEAGEVKFFVYNLMGQTIFETRGHYTMGEHSYTFKHQNLPSGVYYYGIEFNKERIVKKMIIK